MTCEDERSIFIIIAAASLIIYIIFFSGPRSARGLGTEGFEPELISSEEAQEASASAAAASTAAATSVGFLL